jgi:hypothetical protein
MVPMAGMNLEAGAYIYLDGDSLAHSPLSPSLSTAPPESSKFFDELPAGVPRHRSAFFVGTAHPGITIILN